MRYVVYFAKLDKLATFYSAFVPQIKGYQYGKTYWTIIGEL